MQDFRGRRCGSLQSLRQARKGCKCLFSKPPRIEGRDKVRAVSTKVRGRFAFPGARTSFAADLQDTKEYLNSEMPSVRPLLDAPSHCKQKNLDGGNSALVIGF